MLDLLKPLAELEARMSHDKACPYFCRRCELAAVTAQLESEVAARENELVKLTGENYKHAKAVEYWQQQFGNAEAELSKLRNQLAPMTIPTPELEVLKELVQKWREYCSYRTGVTWNVEYCADALESLIPAIEKVVAELHQKVNLAILNVKEMDEGALQSEVCRLQNELIQAQSELELKDAQLAQQKAKEEIKTHPMGGVCPNCLQALPEKGTK